MTDINFIKTNDPDRYLLSLFVSDETARKAIHTLDTLNIEIARLRDVIETPHMGFIRLQWWRDEIRKIYEKKKFAPHDVLESLSIIIPYYQIPHDQIDNLISAREADFEEYDNFDFYNYARSIHSPLLKLKAKFLNEENDASYLAEGYALVGLLRSIPFYKARSQVLLPSIHPDAVRDICKRAEELLNQDKTTHKYFKAHRVLARLYLKQIKDIEFNPEKLTPLAFKELRVWWGV